MFPELSTADEDGLLAIGGDLSTDTLKLAYNSGIFPWFSGKIPMWYSPDPRFVLFPGELVVSKSMKQVLKGNTFSFSTNRDFASVVKACSSTPREGQSGTWITDDMIKAYVTLHEEGIAESAETWMDGQLVGGLYGIRVGKVFCGESMFSHASNASKYAFIKFVELLVSQGIELIDCQVYTPHLESLGARMIPRSVYLDYLRK